MKLTDNSLNVYQYVLSPSVLPVFNESWGYQGHKINSQARGLLLYTKNVRRFYGQNDWQPAARAFTETFTGPVKPLSGCHDGSG